MCKSCYVQIVGVEEYEDLQQPTRTCRTSNGANHDSVKDIDSHDDTCAACSESANGNGHPFREGHALTDDLEGLLLDDDTSLGDGEKATIPDMADTRTLLGSRNGLLCHKTCSQESINDISKGSPIRPGAQQQC